MNHLQKQTLLDKCYYLDHLENKCVLLPEQQEELRELFRYLDENDIEYHSLSIPVLDLDLEQFLDASQIGEFVKHVSKHGYGLFVFTINFDIVIPSLKWVFNIKNSYEVNDDYTAGAVRMSVLELTRLFESFYVNELSKDMAREASIPELRFEELLEKCVLKKIKSMGLEHPYVNNINLRPSFKTESQMTFNKDNFKVLKALLAQKR